MSETHGFRNITYACHVCGISALGIAGTHTQLCITDYKYRYAARKNDYFNWFADQACAHIFGEFLSLKATCPKGQVIGDQHYPGMKIYLPIFSALILPGISSHIIPIS